MCSRRQKRPIVRSTGQALAHACIGFVPFNDVFIQFFTMRPDIVGASVLPAESSVLIYIGYGVLSCL